MDSIEDRTNNVSVLDSQHKTKVIGVKSAAAGDVSNDRIKTCYICKNNGWPHEAIAFERVLGRVLSDGYNETRGWIVRDYFTGQVHCHRSCRQKLER
jgi:hypothetical protein